MKMKPAHIFGITVLGLLWIWLVCVLATKGGGINFKNTFLITASGIIIFVPLFKKWFGKTDN